MGDNGTGNQWYKNSTINGKVLSGKKGEMKECGSLVPLIVSWQGKNQNGIMSDQLIDATDFIPTFAHVIGQKLPENITFDGNSFSDMFIGKKRKKRDWIFIELGNDWYVRSTKWKLNRAGELFDMSNAPFEEKMVSNEDKQKELIKSKRTLQTILNRLAPEKGILDTGTGDGRHATKANKIKSKEADE
jgi:arylsulfatase A